MRTMRVGRASGVDALNPYRVWRRGIRGLDVDRLAPHRYPGGSPPCGVEHEDRDDAGYEGSEAQARPPLRCPTRSRGSRTSRGRPVRPRAPLRPVAANRSASRIRWLRWSRPPVTSVTPRRVREKLTSVTSRIGRPASSAPTSSPAFPASAWRALAIASAATRNPTGMLPPSPRKIFAGPARFHGRKPAQAPESANASPAIIGVPLISGEHADPGRRDGRDRAACAVEVVHQVERVDETDDPERSSAARSIGAAGARCSSQGRSGRQRHGGASLGETRHFGATVTRSSSVPSSHSPIAQPSTTSQLAGRARRCAPPRRRKPTSTAAPPRNGVGASCRRYSRGWS